jgi:arylsulfatase A-like enzyme
MRFFPFLGLILLMPCRECVAALPPDVLLIVSDDQRPDTIRSLGHASLETPSMDRLAAAGTVFSRAYAGYPICHVSRAQMLTGTHAFRALPKYPAGAIDPELATLAGTLLKSGYHTAYTGKWHNDGHPTQRGYAVTSGLFSSGGVPGRPQPETDAFGHPLTGYRGWTFKDARNQPELDKGVGLCPDNSRHMAEGAIRALRMAPADKPLFLHVNFAFPHDPRQWPEGMKDRYESGKLPLPANFQPVHPFDHGNLEGRDEKLLPTPRQPSQVREQLALYYAMITDLDAQLGRILGALRDRENTLVIFTSDQGLALGSHGLLGKQNQYEHSIRSPLIIVGPGLPRGERSEALVNLQDLFPTLCELTGAAVPASVTGKSLRPLLLHQTVRIHEFVTGLFTDTQRMICDGRWKYIRYPKAGREQLFDLEKDPQELNDLSASALHESRRAALQARLLQWCRDQGDPDL